MSVINFNLDDVSCTGNETRLVDCFYPGEGNHNCRPGIDNAAVVCTGKHIFYDSVCVPYHNHNNYSDTACVNGTVRLVGGHI